MVRTILFDLDGTLVDTELAASSAIVDCFRDWGVEPEKEDAAYITGRTWATAFEFLFSKYTVPVSREAAAEKMMATYRKRIETDLQVVPGSADAVRALCQKFPLGLVSGSQRSEIFFALDQLKIRDCFEVVLGAEDYPRSKPAPDGYLKALQMMRGKPANTLIFEDSTAGILSGLNAGAWVVAITGTNHFSQKTEQAHHSITDLRGVDPDWVHALSQNLKSQKPSIS